MTPDGETAADRVHERHEANRLLWWWRVPYLAILAAAIVLLWMFLGGVPGALVAIGVGAIGIWVATVNPWNFGRAG